MRLLKVLGSIVLVVNFTACVSLATEPVSPRADVAADSAYVYGRFKLKVTKDTLSVLNARAAGDIFIFLPKAENKSEGYYIRLDTADDLFAISVKPGAYEWGSVVFARANGGIHARKPLTNNGSPVQLEFLPRKAYYIGDYAGEVGVTFSPGMFQYTWRLADFSANYEATTRDFKQKYAKLSQIEMVNTVPQLVSRPAAPQK